MKRIYVDCLAGLSGSKLLSALLHLCCAKGNLAQAIESLVLPEGITLRQSMHQTDDGAGVCIDWDILTDSNILQLTMPQVYELIEKSPLPTTVKYHTKLAVLAIAEAESKLHNKPAEQIQFDEPPVLTFVTIASCLILLEVLEVKQLHFSAMADFGFNLPVRKQHSAGVVLEIIKNSPVQYRIVETIPTAFVSASGAAIAKVAGSHFGDMLAMATIDEVGYGYGLNEAGIPLRVVYGTVTDNAALERVTVIETNIDDANPEWIGHTIGLLMESGALDAFVLPIYMKKNRPAMQLGCLCKVGEAQKFVRIIFENTTTIGLRMYECERFIMHRKPINVETAFGPVQANKMEYDGIVKYSPEFESCKVVAAQAGIPVKTVYEAVIATIERNAL